MAYLTFSVDIYEKIFDSFNAIFVQEWTSLTKCFLKFLISNTIKSLSFILGILCLYLSNSFPTLILNFVFPLSFKQLSSESLDKVMKYKHTCFTKMQSYFLKLYGFFFFLMENRLKYKPFASVISMCLKLEFFL